MVFDFSQTMKTVGKAVIAPAIPYETTKGILKTMARPALSFVNWDGASSNIKRLISNPFEPLIPYENAGKVAKKLSCGILPSFW